jgi:hypothetical protein
MTEIVGTGPRGDSVIGFMAALGALVVLERMFTDVHVWLSWRRGLTWQPVWSLDTDVAPAAVVARLADALQSGPQLLSNREEWKDLKVPRDDFAQELRSGVDSFLASGERSVDFVSGLGTDAATKREKDVIEDTEFQLMSGHQAFLGSMRKLVCETTEEDVQEALFGPWRYAHKGVSMHWDEADLRVHAYRAKAPTKTVPLGVRGANRLAIEALELFPVIATARGVQTSGFIRRDSRVSLRWPLWTGVQGGLSSRAVRSLILHPTVQRLSAQSDTTASCDERRRRLRAEAELRALGVSSVFEARVVRESHYGNFAPARCLAIFV